MGTEGSRSSDNGSRKRPITLQFLCVPLESRPWALQMLPLPVCLGSHVPQSFIPAKAVAETQHLRSRGLEDLSLPVTKSCTSSAVGPLWLFIPSSVSAFDLLLPSLYFYSPFLAAGHSKLLRCPFSSCRQPAAFARYSPASMVLSSHGYTCRRHRSAVCCFFLHVSQ